MHNLNQVNTKAKRKRKRKEGGHQPEPRSTTQGPRPKAQEEGPDEAPQAKKTQQNHRKTQENEEIPLFKRP